LFLMCFDIVLK